MGAGYLADRRPGSKRGREAQITVKIAFKLARSATLGFTALVALACVVQQRPAENLIDPRLRAQGIALENNGSWPRRGDLELGGYRISEVEVHDEVFDGTGPLASNPDRAGGHTRPTQQLRLTFELHPPAETDVGVWTAECVGQHRQPPDHDLAAAADEAREEIALRCVLVSGDARWGLNMEGDLANNLLGRLEPLAGAREGEVARVVELILWHQLLNFTRRRMPTSLALIRGQIRGQGSTDAAMILDSPERAWLAVELDPVTRARLLTTMVALRLLPLGFES